MCPRDADAVSPSVSCGDMGRNSIPGYETSPSGQAMAKRAALAQLPKSFTGGDARTGVQTQVAGVVK